MKRVFCSALLLAGLLAAPRAQAAAPPAPAGAQPTTAPVAAKATYAIGTDLPGCQLNWLAGQLEAVGLGYATRSDEFGRVQAYTAAMTIMIREIRRALPNIPVDAATTVAAALRDDAQKSVADDLVAGVSVIEERWQPDKRSYTVVGVLPLYGDHGLTVLGANALGAAKPIEAAESQLSILRPVPRGHTPQRSTSPYSGVIIDADRTLVKPCLYPRLLRFDGKELWGPGGLGAVDVINGPVRYAPDLQAALQRKQAGESPLVLQAVGCALGAYPVLNVDDVYLLLTEHKYKGLLNELPIIITLGQR